MAQTCKFIRNTVQKSTFLSYTIDLAYHQLQATDTSTVPYVARKQHLLKSQNRWNKLEWAVKHKVECPHTAYMYDFVNGIYAIGQNAANDRRFSENVTFYRLPPYPTPPASTEDGAGLAEARSANGPHDTPAGNPRVASWTYAFGMTILDFTMDPEQDLLVLLALAPPESVFSFGSRGRFIFLGVVLNMCHPQGHNIFITSTSGLCPLTKRTHKRDHLSYHSFEHRKSPGASTTSLLIGCEFLMISSVP
jgi:hypothetical protein